MNNLLKEFQDLLIETSDIPKDELRDYYLVPARTFINSNPLILNFSYYDKTPLMMVVEQIIKNNNHPIRENYLNLLAMDVIEKTPVELLNYQNKYGDSVIHLTTEIESFSVGLLDILKERGASFSLFNKKLETPLIKIASTNSLDDLKFILSYTDKNLINHQDYLGQSAIFYAILKRKINNIYFLIENNAELFLKNIKNQTIFDIIRDEKYKKMSDKKYYQELMFILSKKLNYQIY